MPKNHPTVIFDLGLVTGEVCLVRSLGILYRQVEASDSDGDPVPKGALKTMDMSFKVNGRVLQQVLNGQCSGG